MVVTVALHGWVAVAAAAAGAGYNIRVPLLGCS